jgi:hypothetical protein
MMRVRALVTQSMLQRRGDLRIRQDVQRFKPATDLICYANGAGSR